MTNNDQYLQEVLHNQELGDKSDELEKLRKIRANVETLLKAEFNNPSPVIRYGGSYAKGTMIRENYDLDIICYFLHDDTNAGENLEDIFSNVKKALESQYYVQPKTSALRLKGKSSDVYQLDFHVDVVPGRFTDDNKSDAYLYQKDNPDKCRLKTNIDKHIKVIKESGYTSAIKLIKLWNTRKQLNVKTFVLELLVIKVLSEARAANIPLDQQLSTFWNTIKDKTCDISIEDPANTGNDLTPIFGDSIKALLTSVSSSTVDLISSSGWEAVFGPANEADSASKISVITAAAQNGSDRARPWCDIL